MTTINQEPKFLGSRGTERTKIENYQLLLEYRLLNKPSRVAQWILGEQGRVLAAMFATTSEDNQPLSTDQITHNIKSFKNVLGCDEDKLRLDDTDANKIFYLNYTKLSWFARVLAWFNINPYRSLRDIQNNTYDWTAKLSAAGCHCTNLEVNAARPHANDTSFDLLNALGGSVASQTVPTVVAPTAPAAPATPAAPAAPAMPAAPANPAMPAAPANLAPKNLTISEGDMLALS